MLTLADAAAYFDRTPILHPDNDLVLFYGQVDPFDESRRDAVAAYRRILSVAPGTAIPTSRAIKVHGQVWIVGGYETDGLADPHRQKYVLHPAGGKFSISTLSGFLSGSVVTTAWADIEWLKDAKEESQSSRPIPISTAYLGKNAPLSEYSVLHSGSEAYLTLAVRRTPSGLLSGTCLLLQHSVAAAALATRAYDPVAGSYSTTATASVNCLRVRWQSLFMYDSMADAKYQEGDCSLVLPFGTAVDTASRITLAGQVWAVVSSEVLGGAVVVHARLA